MPPQQVPPCEGLGAGARPLLSKDARRVSVFIGSDLVVRNVADCSDIVFTNTTGAKADFSWDGQYVAFHAPRAVGKGFEIKIVDLYNLTIRSFDWLAGSALFPSWTEDGRLLFYYEEGEFRGFAMAKRPLLTPARALPRAARAGTTAVEWSELFPGNPWVGSDSVAVVVWAPWSAHVPGALIAAQEVSAGTRARSERVRIYGAVEPQSEASQASRLLQRHRISLQDVELSSSAARLTSAYNQIPVTLLFRHGRLVAQHLGAQSASELREWVTTIGEGANDLLMPSPADATSATGGSGLDAVRRWDLD